MGGNDGGGIAGNGAGSAPGQEPASPYEEMWWALHDDLRRVVREAKHALAYGIQHDLPDTEPARRELIAVDGILSLMLNREAGAGVSRSGEPDLADVGEEPADGGTVEGGAAGVGVVHADDVWHRNEPAGKGPWI